MSLFGVPRALITLAADALEAVAFWLMPHDFGAADRLWDEATRRHEWADGLVEREAEQEVAEPYDAFRSGGQTVAVWYTGFVGGVPGRPDPSTGRPGTPTDELVAAIDFGLENCPEDSPPLIAGYPVVNQINTDTSSARLDTVDERPASDLLADRENFPSSNRSLGGASEQDTGAGHPTSSVDGEAAVSAVSGPSAGESPAPDSDAVTDAGPPTAMYATLAADGLREWADGQPCEAPTFWRDTADLLDPTKGQSQ